MFVITTIADTVCIPPPMFVQSTIKSVHQEIEKKYPNRVLMDVGLVICRYGDVLKIGDGVCVAGDGGAHHEVVFRLIVFRPFVEEVCVGQIMESNEEGIRVSLGNFFHDIFIPEYWMLRPSTYDRKAGLWVWIPEYDDDDENDMDNNNGNGGEGINDTIEKGAKEQQQRFEMVIGAEIRFKVKSINFTQVTNTAKGVQATTTTMSTSFRGLSSHKTSGKSSDAISSTTTGVKIGGTPEDLEDTRPVRKRSSSVDLSDSAKIPASMHITASICEDGLGLTSWWTSAEEDEAQQEEEGGYEQNFDREEYNDEEYYEEEQFGI